MNYYVSALNGDGLKLYNRDKGMTDFIENALPLSSVEEAELVMVKMQYAPGRGGYSDWAIEDSNHKPVATAPTFAICAKDSKGNSRRLPPQTYASSWDHVLVFAGDGRRIIAFDSRKAASYVLRHMQNDPRNQGLYNNWSLWNLQLGSDVVEDITDSWWIQGTTYDGESRVFSKNNRMEDIDWRSTLVRRWNTQEGAQEFLKKEGSPSNWWVVGWNQTLDTEEKPQYTQEATGEGEDMTKTEILKDDVKTATYQAAAEGLVLSAAAAITTKGPEFPYKEEVTLALSTEVGRSALALLLGMVQLYTPQLQSKKAQQLGSALRVNAGRNALVSTATAMFALLVTAFGEALSVLPEEKEGVS